MDELRPHGSQDLPYPLLGLEKTGFSDSTVKVVNPFETSPHLSLHPLSLPTIAPTQNWSNIVPETLSWNHLFGWQTSINDILQQDIYPTLQQFAQSPDFQSQMHSIFGDNLNAGNLNEITSQWLVGNFQILPQIEVLEASIFPTETLGVFAGETNKIYLSENLLSSGNIETIKDTVIEEIGHYLDKQINVADTPGDEGKLFAAVVTDKHLNANQIAEIRAEDDSTTIFVDGQILTVEQATLSTITISASDANAAETIAGQTANPGLFTLTRAGDIASSLAVNYTISGTATNGTDYQTLTNSITFAAGLSTAIINVTPSDDTVFEGNETIILNLASSANYILGTTKTATVNLVDNDKPTITISATDTSAGETLTGQIANPGKFTLTRTGSTASSLTVNYTVAGTATNGTDYQTLTKIVTFAAGSATAIIDVTPIDDAVFEGNETAIVTLASATSYVLGTTKTATVNLVDNDKPTITISATDTSAGEILTGQTANPGKFTLTRTGSTASSLIVNYTVAGTATNGTDYNTLTGIATFAAGSATAIIDVNVKDDAVFEGNETAIVTLASATSYVLGTTKTATVNLVDNDKPTITISATDASAGEILTGQTANPGKFTLTRTGSTTSSLIVNYTVAGTATNGTDYNTLTGIATFAAGSATAIIDVNVKDDAVFEGNETAIVTLASATSYVLGTTKTATVNLVDNDTATNNPPTITISATDASARETVTGQTANPGQFTLTRTGNTTTALTVNYTLSGTATKGTDYSDLSGSVTFAAGSATAIVNVTPINDTVAETNETVILTLATGTGYNLGTAKSSTVTLISNDEPTFYLNIAGSDYEYLIKEVREDWVVGQQITVQGHTYTAKKVFNDTTTGFYAVGFTSNSNTRPPLLVVRGTQPETRLDVLEDANPQGIGFGQFSANNNQIKQWLNQFAVNSISGYYPIIVGESLGGAVAQSLAAAYTNQGGKLSQVFTLNSPGIDDALASSFKPENVGKVIHGVVFGDLVSLAGEEYISGEYWLFDWNTENSKIYGSPLIDYILDKHNQEEDNLFDNPSISIIKGLGSSDLSSPLFSYWNRSEISNEARKDWASFNGTITVLGVVTGVVGTILPPLGALGVALTAVPAALISRSSEELTRLAGGTAITAIDDLINTLQNPSIEKLVKLVTKGLVLTGGIASETLEAANDLSSEIVGGLFDIFVDVAKVLKNELSVGLGDIAEFLMNELGAGLGDIAKILWNNNLVANARELANVLWNNTSATISDIANSLKSQLDFATSTIADALSYGANLSIDQITNALWNTTFVANGRELANVLWNNTSATVSNIANSLKSQLNFATSSIADALSYGAN
ncbi:beta strand repeat-containing protein, partial [Anabaena catenula]